MKKIAALFIAYLLLLISFSPVLAHEDDPATEAAMQKDITTTTSSKIEAIKEKIASTVAQLNLVSKKAFVGEISKLEKGQITIEKAGVVKIIDVDELTRYTIVGKDGKRSDAKFSDLGLDNTIVTIGIYNKDSRKLLARIIFIKRIPVNINGIVREIDIQDGAITVEDKKQNKIYTIEVEKMTVIRIYSKSGGLVKSGLSKIEIGQRAHINGIANDKEESRISAARILLLPGKAVSITTGIPQKVATSSATPTSILKPTVTPKPTKKPASPTGGSTLIPTEKP